MPGNHALVACEFLVLAKVACGVVQQRVEPENAAQERSKRVALQVPMTDVRIFVLAQKLLLVGGVALVEVGRHDHEWPEQSYRRRQAGD